MNFPKKSVMSQLHSTNQRDLAVTLSNLMIDQEPDEWVRGKLRTVRDIVWDNENYGSLAAPLPDSYEVDKKRRQSNMMRIHGIMQEAPDDATRKKLADAYAHLGHLYEIAGHAARENFFLDREVKLKAFTATGEHGTPERDILVPGGMHDMLYHGEAFKGETVTVDDAIARLNAPVSEYIFTQHPTNTNTLKSMELQRDIAMHIDELVRTDLGFQTSPTGNIELDLQALKDKIKEFADEKLVSDDNFTVYDETNIVISHLRNSYQDLDLLYEATERGLQRRFPDTYNEQKRRDLDLKLRFGSWGSAGDKDGNAKIKSENTLEAIALHKHEAAHLLADDLDKIGALPEALANWKHRLKNAETAYQRVIDAIELKRRGGDDIPLTKADFKQYSRDIQNASRDLGERDQFLAAIDTAIDGAQGDNQKDALLSLKRKARVFGFNLGKIEYRETAEEYERALAFLLARPEVTVSSFSAEAAEYVAAYKLIEAERTAVKNKEKKDVDEEIIAAAEKRISAVLPTIMDDAANHAVLTEAAKNFMESADPTTLRKYSDAETGDAAVVYHTLRRMELARDFAAVDGKDSMITHNVLAECKGTQNLLQALAMQIAAGSDANGNRSLMHIVPLFEEADTMEKIQGVIEGGLDSKPYHKHLEALQERDKTPTIVQQVQIAHSDNARRAGAIASRGIIHEGHRAAHAAETKYNETHADKPVTVELFEGGSLSDSYRNGVRAATEMIKDFGLGKQFKATFQGGDLLNYFNNPTSIKRLTLRNLVEQATLLATTEHPNGTHSALEKVVVSSISDLQHQYDVNYYNHPANPLGIVLHALDYRAQNAAGSAGTRLNRSADLPKDEATTGVDPRNMRTISFSECLQHGNIHPSCLGTSLLVDTLRQKFAASEEARRELHDAFNQFRQENPGIIPEGAVSLDNLGQLTAAGLKYLYRDGSPTFKDAIDKMAYSLVNTRVDAFTQKLEEYQQKIMREESARDETLDKAFHAILHEYDDAARLVYRTLSGAEITPEERQRLAINQGGTKNDSIATVDRLIHKIRELPALEHLEMHNYKHGFLDGLDIIAKQSGLENSRLVHNAKDTVCHGRTITADDPRYGKAYVAHERQQRATAVQQAAI